MHTETRPERGVGDTNQLHTLLEDVESLVDDKVHPGTEGERQLC
jgi:hypothetical protein